MSDEEIEWLDALLEIDEGLGDWEVEFIESLSHRRDYDLSDRQHDCLERIFDDHG